MGIIQLSFIDGKCCRVCKQWHPLSNFTKYKRSADRLSYDCKDCDRVRYRKWLESDKENNLARMRENAHKPERRARRSEYYKKYYSVTREERHRHYKEYYAINRADVLLRRRARYEQYKPRRRQWLANNRARHTAQYHRYKARKLANGGTYTLTHWDALCNWFGRTCLRCQSTGKLTVDHVIPLNLGGSNSIHNLQPLCLSCNCSKRDTEADYRDPVLFAAFLTSIGEPIGMVQVVKK